MLTYISMILACCMAAKVDRRRLYGGSNNNDEFNNNNNNNNDGFNNNDGYGVDINNNDFGNNDFGNSNDFAGGFSGASSGSYSTGGSYSSDSSGASTAQVTMSASNVFEDGFDLDYQFTGPEEGSQLHYYIREEGCGACSQDEPSLSEILSGDGATCYGSYSGNDEFDHNEHVNCGLSSASQYKLYVARSSTCCDAELVYSGMTMVVNSGHYEMATGYGTGYGVEAETVNGGVAVSGGYSAPEIGYSMGGGYSSGGSSGGSSSSSSGGSSSSSSSSGGSSGGSDSSGSGGGGDWSDGDEEEGDDDDDDDDDDGIMLQGPTKNLGKSLAPTPTMVLVVVGSVCMGIAAGLLFSCLRRKRALSHEDFYSGLAESGDVHLDNTATVV